MTTGLPVSGAAGNGQLETVEQQHIAFEKEARLNDLEHDHIGYVKGATRRTRVEQLEARAQVTGQVQLGEM